MRIAEAAESLSLPTHVLRHWEDVGVLRPKRTSAWHRVFDDELVTQARLVLVCQRAGLSLAQIAELRDGDAEQRAAVIATHRARIATQQEQLARADAFLAHVLQCTHPVVTQCPECSGFAGQQTSDSPAAQRAGGGVRP